MSRLLWLVLLVQKTESWGTARFAWSRPRQQAQIARATIGGESRGWWRASGLLQARHWSPVNNRTNRRGLRAVFLISSPTTDGRPPSQFLPPSHRYLAQLGFVSPGLLFSGCALLLWGVFCFVFFIIMWLRGCYEGLGQLNLKNSRFLNLLAYPPIILVRWDSNMRCVVSVSLTSNDFCDLWAASDWSIIRRIIEEDALFTERD